MLRLGFLPRSRTYSAAATATPQSSGCNSSRRSGNASAQRNVTLASAAITSVPAARPPVALVPPRHHRRRGRRTNEPDKEHHRIHPGPQRWRDVARGHRFVDRDLEDCRRGTPSLLLLRLAASYW